ncbi:MAG: YeeE/YedE thiosulfate transporter family protein [Pedobacter sp.]|nr:YeeE/YedE thiosulfate transporter family protein [Pedobacter sp.]
MNLFELWPQAAGGAAIGAAVALLLLFTGEIAGISGIHAGLLRGDSGRSHWRAAFLAGLVLPGFYLAAKGATPATVAWPLLIIAGLLVGFGTRTGGGCTSGHGVCGIANLSRRSIFATLVFMATAMLTVFITRHLL